MAQKLTDKAVRSIEAPAFGYTIIYDTEIPGFALRVTSATAKQMLDPQGLQGSRAFIVNYRVKSTSRERRYTIGKYPAWSVAAAREEARELRKRIDRGEDPMAERAFSGRRGYGVRRECPRREPASEHQEGVAAPFSKA